jgi:hypothetical protein
MRATSQLIPLCFAITGAISQAFAQQTELHSSFEAGTYCSESPPDTLDPRGLDCGYTFYEFMGRVSWPPLTYVAPIVISVHTLDTPSTAFPLYVNVEVYHHSLSGCSTLLAGRTVLAAYGARQCGGTWETIGPLDLFKLIGLPLGERYLVQVIFLRHPGGPSSVGLARIDVTPEITGIAAGTWGHVKALYR